MNDQARLLSILKDQPRSRAELEVMLGLTKDSVTNRLIRLRGRKLIRVVEWRRQPAGVKGAFIAVYGLEDPLEPLGDAPKPAPVSVEERRARYNAAHPDRLKATKARYRAKDPEKFAARTRDAQQRYREKHKDAINERSRAHQRRRYHERKARKDRQGQVLWGQLTWATKG